MLHIFWLPLLAVSTFLLRCIKHEDKGDCSGWLKQGEGVFCVCVRVCIYSVIILLFLGIKW